MVSASGSFLHWKGAIGIGFALEAAEESGTGSCRGLPRVVEGVERVSADAAS